MKVTKSYLKRLIKETLVTEVRFKRKEGTELPIQQFYLWFKKMLQILPKDMIFMSPDYVHDMGHSKKNAQQVKKILVDIIREDKKNKNDTYGHIWALEWKKSDINYLADREIKPAMKGPQEFDLEKLYDILSKDKKLANHIQYFTISFNSKTDSEHHDSVVNSGPLD